ncbi:hypothetical protein [Mycobacteroides abscessus]|uniref:hypothetical protein n=1 Tax=Mycobacteroides abscessus TaxID=36809 RepID=UPI00092C2401|nr:hypothetical protein [Mycobacteroides abscessus]QSN49767.1 hypothetical protein I3U33_26930 [Mycobacteroides abscessus subsp. abscessus]SII83631.1 Uncharacterised protein [Mycobacteroides abscessus subsp. abscessus]SIK57493.1 Uncharacterised protein [Mycobacteroides abscessus subsp. abscessus]SIL84058.1 Uncharacterised protein [Mycobacteroides abscessus subsp. abscessus]SIM12772.1 Uncharacterised protein [Mycobacteroides abscessus subsp. abscessus]
MGYGIGIALAGAVLWIATRILTAAATELNTKDGAPPEDGRSEMRLVYMLASALVILGAVLTGFAYLPQH